jgi:hypothetical protein
MPNHNIVNHVEGGGVIFSGTFTGPISVDTSDQDGPGAVIFVDDEEEDRS